MPVIDKSGDWWKGDSLTDLSEFVVEFTSRNYQADDIRPSRCVSCGGTTFELLVDDDEGCARRVCCECNVGAFLADSEDYWDDAGPGAAECSCGASSFELVSGFSLLETGEVRWVTIGARCPGCGILGVYAEWKIDYEPSRQLLEKI